MGERTVIIISVIVFAVIILSFIIGIFLYVKEYRNKKKRYELELETKDILHEQELLATQLEIQKETMASIGREIHDNVGQKLTLSSLYLQQLSYENESKPIQQPIDSINEIINDSLKELRQLSKSLTNDKITTNSIEELIQEECDKINELQKCEVSLKNSLSTELQSYQTKSVLLRVTQEFLQNSIKHSGCKSISIDLSSSDDHLHLELKDDGKGFDINTAKQNGIGLKNMRKRIEMINGIFKLASTKESGTRLNVTIPLP